MTRFTRRDVLGGLGALGGASILGAASTVNSSSNATRDSHFASVRVVHAIPDAPPVDVTIDGNPLLDEFAFPGVSIYYTAEPGSYDVAVSIDTDENEDGYAESSQSVLEGTLTLEPSARYTVAATGTAGGDVMPELSVFEDSLVAPPAETTGTGTTGTGTMETTGTGTMETTGTGTMETTGTGTMETTGTPGTGTTETTGTGTPGTTGTMETQTQTPGGQVGTPAPTSGMTQTPGQPQSERSFSGARVRGVHLSPDAGDVEIEVSNGVNFATQLGFRDATSYLSLDPGEVQLLIRHLESDSEVGPYTLSVSEGVAYSVFAMGYLFDDDEVQLGGDEGFRVVPVKDFESGGGATTGTETTGTSETGTTTSAGETTTGTSETGTTTSAGETTTSGGMGGSETTGEPTTTVGGSTTTSGG